MGKPKLISIYVHEKINRIWVDARFKPEKVPIEMIEVRFSLPNEDQRDISELEDLATAKAEKYLHKTLKLMNESETTR